jgi:hypothetical protein
MCLACSKEIKGHESHEGDNDLASYFLSRYQMPEHHKRQALIGLE